MQANHRKVKKRLQYVWFVVLGLTAVLQLLARNIDGFAQWYGTYIYPIFVHTIGRFCSIFPFSLIEFLLYGLILYIIIQVIYCITKTSKQEQAKVYWEKFGRFIVTIVSFLLLLFTLTCGINYFRDSFSEVSGFTIREHNEEELRELCEYLVEEINTTSAQLERDEKGLVIMNTDVNKEAQKAMKKLSEKYSVLNGYYPNAKPVFFSKILTYQYIMGVYSPFTLEANYNKDMLTYELPYSICHELSHLKGFMREDEAGFIAYLACHYSDNVMFQYSGAMEAFSYAIGAYYDGAGYAAYMEVFSMLDETVIAEIQTKNLWWSQHKSFVQEVSSQVNDIYLKANAHEDGIQSYGRMVDLLLEEYISHQKKEA